MSLRRPRIKSAVNLAALANGRRKTSQESQEQKPGEATNEKTAETSTNNSTEEIQSPNESVINEVNQNGSGSIPSQSSDDTNAIVQKPNDDGLSYKEIPKTDISNPEKGFELNAEETKPSDLAHEKQNGSSEKVDTPTEIDSSKENHFQNSSLASPKVIENPFSPPPPVRPGQGGSSLRFKPRFKPNLNENRNRIRRFSGSLTDLGSPPPCHGSPQKKVRTISCSSSNENESEATEQAFQEEVLNKRPPPIQRMVVLNEVTSPPASSNPDKWLKSPPSIETDVKSPAYMSPAPRQRLLTETRDSTDGLENRDPTVFEIRKADHRKKFTTGIPERTNITMFDLIYYNPCTGSRMSNSNSRSSSRANSRANSRASSVDHREEVPPLEAVRQRLEEEAVDDVAPIEEENNQGSVHDSTNEDEVEDAMPVPQVKVGPDGSIIIDESTTLIETTAAKKAKEDLLKTPLIFESSDRATNYGSWLKRKKSVDWSEKETVRFFKALSILGTDFSMMANLFKKRSRHELKMKYKKEEKQNKALVDRCLTKGLQFDSSIMESEEEEEEPTLAEKKLRAKQKAKANPKPKQKKARRVKKKRGYYASSDEEEIVEDDRHQVSNPKKKKRGQSNAEILQQGINIAIPDLPSSKTGGKRKYQKKNVMPNTALPADPLLMGPPSTIASSGIIMSPHSANYTPFLSPRPASVISPRPHNFVSPNPYMSPRSEFPMSPQSSQMQTMSPRSDLLTSPRPLVIASPNPSANMSPRQDYMTSPRSDSMMSPKPVEVHGDAGSLLKALLTKNASASPVHLPQSPSFAFPPALLAANPSLASAAPGSLVVVASPASSSMSPNAQLLQVFVVGEGHSDANEITDGNQDEMVIEETYVSVVDDERCLLDSTPVTGIMGSTEPS